MTISIEKTIFEKMVDNHQEATRTFERSLEVHGLEKQDDAEVSMNVARIAVLQEYRRLEIENAELKEPKMIYTVIMKDRHVDDDVQPFLSFDKAFDVAQQFWKYFDEELSRPRRTDRVGTLLFEQIDSGGYSVEIRAHKLEA